MINKGHTTADQVGLYHYTVVTNMVSNLEIKETNSVVDIGYHYVAVGTNGVPIDNNGNAIPDYIEDVNGNGLLDSGETPWEFSILIQPLSQEVEDGDSVTFGVVTGGNLNLTYQWTFNGVAIDGATNSIFTIDNVQDVNAGAYAVTISDGINSLISTTAQLTTDSSKALGCTMTGDYNLVPILGARQNYTFRSGKTSGETCQAYGLAIPMQAPPPVYAPCLLMPPPPTPLTLVAAAQLR